MDVVRVEHKEGDHFEVAMRGHVVHVDQPLDDGGTDLAPTPTELLIASLASCVAFYARRYLTRHDLSTEGLAVTASYQIAGRPARVGEIAMTLTVPGGVPEERRAPLLAVASHCTVHNTLQQAPEVTIELR
jgi:putative redox protein